MRTIYIDNNFVCHATNNGTTPIETDRLDNVCDLALECYHFVPSGNTWHGVVLDHDFVECFDTKLADKLNEQNRIGFEKGQEDILSFVEEQLGVLE